MLRPRATLCAAAAVCTLLTSCTRIGNPFARTNPWTHHGELRIAGRQSPDNLNTLLGTQTVDTDLSMFWAGYLFNYNDRNEYVPELAERIPTQANGDISRDGLRITYHLRRNVKWQDGAPFTADDVIYTWRQILNPRNLVVSRLGYDIIARIDKRDDATIDVHLKKPFSPFVATFFTMSNHSDAILPKHLLQNYPDINRVPYNGLPVGTGPFRMARYDRGSQIVFEANPLYWRGRPKLERIVYRMVDSDTTMLTLLRTHEIDFYYRASETLVPSLRSIPGTRLLVAPFTRFADLGLNAGNPILADRRVRQALAYGTDRKEIIDKVTQGMALPANSTQPEFSWAYNPEVARYPYDPKRAAALLDEAGWRAGADGTRRKNGVPLHLDMIGFTGSSTAANTQVLVQHQWAGLGIDVSIKNFPSSQLYATLGSGGIEQAGKFDVVFENWANGTDPDQSILFRCTMAPPAGWNVYHFCSKDVDAAEAAALVEYDQEKRKALYAREQAILAAELPIIMLWYQQQIDVVNTDFKGYKPAHAVTPFWNTWEWSI